MGINERPTLTPEMLLFEVAGLLSRAGIAVDTSNPGAARHYAERLLGVLVLHPAEPAALPPAPRPADATQAFPIIITQGGGGAPGATGSVTIGGNGVAGRGSHRATRPFSVVPDGSA